VYQKVFIQGLLLDPITERPILVLREEGEQRILPIWIGVSEANAIALQLENVKVPRPMTHDLLCGILSQMHGQVKEVRICDLQDNTYFADIVLEQAGEEVHVDARPSDAVALAVRADAPIFVEETIFDRCGETEEAGDFVRSWFEQLSPEDLGRYRM
jgi:hypothetical protein